MHTGYLCAVTALITWGRKVPASDGKVQLMRQIRRISSLFTLLFGFALSAGAQSTTTPQPQPPPTVTLP